MSINRQWRQLQIAITPHDRSNTCNWLETNDYSAGEMKWMQVYVQVFCSQITYLTNMYINYLAAVAVKNGKKQQFLLHHTITLHCYTIVTMSWGNRSSSMMPLSQLTSSSSMKPNQYITRPEPNLDTMATDRKNKINEVNTHTYTHGHFLGLLTKVSQETSSDYWNDILWSECSS